MQSLQALRDIQEQRWTQFLSEGVSPFHQKKWAENGIATGSVKSLADLQRLPFTTKAELMQDQLTSPPYGSNLTHPITSYVRLHQTSGTTTGQPLRWLDTAASWDWILHCWQSIYDIVGVTATDRFFFPFSFGPFLGFWAAFEGAARRGCLVLPGGGASTTARLKFLIDNQGTIVCSTPTYALRMLEVAQEEGIRLDQSSVRLLILAGEPGANIPSTRKIIEEGWGARVIDHWGMTEVGPLGIECKEQPGGFHLLEEECIAEVLHPDTSLPVKNGDEGELVITTLGRLHSPVVRFRTGDRVRLDPQPCACGRPWKRCIGGVLGRTDDMILIKGNNFYPSMIEEIIRGFSEIDEFQVVIDSRRPGDFQLRLELKAESQANNIKEGVLTRFRDTYQFKPDIEVVSPGTLPRSEMKSKRIVRIK